MAMKLVDHEVLDQRTFYGKLAESIPLAKSLIIIHSPFVYAHRVKQLAPVLSAARRRGVSICILLQESASEPQTEREKFSRESRERAIEQLIALDSHVCYRPEIHEKIAVIDEHILYDGSLNVLSQSKSTERMNRWESREMVRDAIAMHKLDTCDQCISLRLAPDTLEHLRLSLIEQRNALELTQHSLARLSGVAQSTISNFESGKTNINLITIDRLCSTLKGAIRSIPKFMAPSLDRQLHQLSFSAHIESAKSSLPNLQWTLVHRRKSLLISQRELANAVGLTQLTIANSELNKSVLDLDTHELICGALDLTTRFIPSSLIHTVDANLCKFWMDDLDALDQNYKKVQEYMNSLRLARFEKQNTHSNIESIFGCPPRYILT